MMRRALRVFGLVVGGLLLGAAGLFFWASSGALPEGELSQIRTYAAGPDTTRPDPLTITTYNIGYLSGRTNNEPVVRPDSLFHANMDQVVDFFRGAAPDLVALQEIDFGGARAAHVHQLDTLATRLGYSGAAQAVNWDERYLPFPYGRPAVHFGRILSGQAVLSRLPVRRHVRTVLPRPPQPFFRDAFYLDRLAQVSVVDVDGHPLAVLNVHLEAFHVETREEQARTVNELYRRLADRGIPTLLLGDFNSRLVPETQAAQEGTADATMHRLLRGTDLRPATDTTAAESTYPSDAPAQKIDHILYPPQFFEVARARRWCGTPAPPSDHCAVTASLRPVAVAEWPSYDALPSLSGGPRD
ncbi:endonuclease/exonuclease/phosphatase family protein [Salinibacter altiplanensis]|uniref:endonuclease/exonuclease/phosphatase family protein n=1 Tax=Salinibacter altiplanensis TaxID=1803181 RepID=UPI001F2FCD2D|nr:endonuclease/exonuclease/phosphatase family protein [Salinibacter altiplanensis]